MAASRARFIHTIAEGTPRGMPAWKDKLTPDQIWQIVTYIQSKHQ